MPEVYPADFAYLRATSVEHAIDLLGDEDTEVKLIAGGQSLLPMMKLRLATPEVLVDIGGLDELCFVRADGPRTRIGALTTYRTVRRDAPTVRRHPAIGDALDVLADPQVRARGTVGGCVAHGDPAADLPAVLLALDTRLTVAGRAGRRTVDIDDFMIGVYTTDLAEDEILVELTLPEPVPGQAYEKFEQPASHLPIAGVCAAVRLDGAAIGTARVAVTGVSGRPFRATAAERMLAGSVPDTATLHAAAACVADGVEPLGDQHASGPFRLHLAEVLTRRALTRAVTRAGVPIAQEASR